MSNFQALRALSQSIWEGLSNVTLPVINVSCTVFFAALLAFNMFCFFLSVLTGGKQDQREGGRFDNNNNYIYRR